MKNLKRLYDEVSPKFLELQQKRDEVGQRVRSIMAELEEAEKNYDIEKVEKLNNSLLAVKKVDERINQDLQKYKEQLNEKSGLFNQISKALQADAKIENEDREVQGLFKELQELEKQIADIQVRLGQKEFDKKDEYRGMLLKFNSFLDGDNSIRLNNLSFNAVKYYPIKQDN